MNINSRNIFIIYLFLYISLLLGFYFNEDFAGGYIQDYLLHQNMVNRFDANFIESAPDEKTQKDELVFYLKKRIY